MLVTLFVLLWVGTSVLYGYGLYAGVVVGDADVVASLPQVITGVLVLGFVPALGAFELQRGQGVNSPDGIRSRPTRLYVWLGITAILAVVHAVASLVAGVPLLVVVGFLLGAVGAGAASWILVIRAKAAADVRRSERSADADSVTIDLDWTADTARRKWRTIGIVLGVGVVLGLVLLVLLPHDDAEDLRSSIAAAVQFAFLAPMIACVVISFGAQVSSGSITGGVSTQDRRAIVRRAAGKGDELDPELEWRAARLAVFSTTVQPFQFAQSLFLFVGIFVPNLIRGIDGWFTIVGIALLALFAATVPWVVIQFRRAKGYADTVRDLARSYVPRSAAPVGD